MKRFFIFFFLFFILSPLSAFAKENFSQSINANYNISDDGPTAVEWNIKIKNNTSQFIASSYKLFIDYPDASNISVNDSGGPVDFAEKDLPNGKELTINFKNKAAGINKEKDFTLKFSTNKIYKTIFNTKEININKIPDSAKYKNKSASVTLPNSINPLDLIKPEPDSTKGNSISYKDFSSAIKIISGEYRVYDLNLTYYLYNTNLFKATQEFALPQDTSYQQIYIQNMNPLPNNVRIDEDGNYLASYILEPSQKLKINVEEKVKVYLEPNFSEIYNLDSNSLIRERNFWPVNSSTFKSLSRNKSPEENYQLTLEKLKYSSAATNRQGIDSLNANFSSSRDFADTLVTFLRTNKIPAREIQGFLVNDSTLNTNDDPLHFWSEYFDFKKNKWIMTDPSLADAKSVDYFNSMDLDHITFSTLGTDSQKPLPAGNYKFNNIKTVQVKSSLEFGLPKSQIKIRTEFDKKYTAGFKIIDKIYFRNLTGAKISNQKVNITSESLLPKTQKIDIPVIPPYGEVALNVEFSAPSVLTNEVDTFKITLGQDTINQNVRVIPIYKDKNILILLGGILIVITIGIFIITRRTRHI